MFTGIAKSSISLKQVHLNYTALTGLLSAPANLQSMTKVSHENQLYSCEQYQLYPHKTAVQNCCPKLQTQAIIKTQISVLQNNALRKL